MKYPIYFSGLKITDEGVSPVRDVALAQHRTPRVFVDMDGVIVDFAGYMVAHGLTSAQVKEKPGAYLDMPAMPGAIAAVRSLIGMGYEVWIATKPPTGVPHAYSDKAAWIMRELPELKRRIIITHDKGLLGERGDWLIDDRPHKANCRRFKGTLIPFMDAVGWPQILELLAKFQPNKSSPTMPRIKYDAQTHAGSAGVEP